jgi:pimeloyl-ACP methyl ester carboxylesterase
MPMEDNETPIMRGLDSASQQIILKDGRTLGYAEYGVPDGKPVFYFHGNPSSRLEGRRLDELGKENKARIIAVDRPGIGLSDFKVGRRYLDWPNDVIELADRLGINRFAILGASGGGPYAMVCALKIPQRLTAVVLVSSPCPVDMPAATREMSRFQRLSIFVVRRALWLARVRLNILARSVYRDPAGVITKVNGQIADIDRVVMEKEIIGNPEELKWVIACLQQAFRSGSRGVVWDYSMLMKPWGFRLEEISIPIKLWHGESDKTVPPNMGRYLESVIPDCQANFIPNEGHYMFFHHARDILIDLVNR